MSVKPSQAYSKLLSSAKAIRDQHDKARKTAEKIRNELATTTAKNNQTKR